MHTASTLIFTIICVSLLIDVPAALARDGVLEINQTCATSTGCFSGDSAGFPVTINGSAGRSYVLTSDLSTGDPNLDGIELSSARLTIDFNGFGLSGPAIGSGTGIGVVEVSAFAGYATLRDGSIRGFRGRGIDLGSSSGVRVENMVIQFNAGGGMMVGAEAQVLGNRVSDNGSQGTSADGIIVLGAGGFVHDNVVVGVPRVGINSRTGSTLISENVVRDFGQTGITAAGSGNSVHRCTIRGGGSGTGISFDDLTSSYHGNTISGVLNTVLSGVDAGANVCNGVTPCP